MAITDIDALVPKAHLVRKVEKVMDYDWRYDRLAQFYCEDNGRLGTDPVVLVKMVLLQHFWNPIPAANPSRNRGKYGVPLVFRLRYA